MKTFIRLSSMLIVLLPIALLCASCTKTGPQGPAGTQGAKGDNGDKGNTGAVGPAGKDGSTLYSGTGTPDPNSGITGDYYLDKNTGALYGPKTTSGWGTAISLIGPKGDKGTTGATGSQGAKGDQGTTGTAGKNGSQILSGNGAPNASTGSIGDFYLDKTSILLYGPKQTASNWGPALMLNGKDGNANVKAYLITNPYDYLNPYAMGAFDVVFGGNFDLTTSVQNNHLISVYVKGTGNSLFPANQDFKGSYNCTNFIAYNALSIRIYKDDGSAWADLDAFKQLVNLTDFVVFDIAPSIDLNISRKAYTPAQRDKAIQQIVASYLKQGIVLRKN